MISPVAQQCTAICFSCTIDNLREKYIRLYEALETELNLLLRSIAILSKRLLTPTVVSTNNTCENFTESYCHDQEQES